MAVVDRHLTSSPSSVFAVLCDGWLYGNWVVGTSHVRAVDPGWPAVGTRVHHATGVWPAVVAGDTVVEAVDPDQRLVLTAHGGPLGSAAVDLEVRPDGTGTRVTMSEAPISGPGRLLGRLADPGIAFRNREALRRLDALATGVLTSAGRSSAARLSAIRGSHRLAR